MCVIKSVRPEEGLNMSRFNSR